MKYLKATAILFIITLILSTITASATDGFSSVVGVTLPTLGGEVDATTGYKTELGKQYYKSNGTVDMLTSKYVNIKVKTRNTSNVESTWLTLGRLDTAYWEEVENYNTGSYTLVARRENWALSEAKHSGSWYLNQSLYELVNQENN